jgi:hypothetical protein
VAEARAAVVESAKPLIVPSGTVITVRLTRALGSDTSKTGQAFTAVVDEAVSIAGKVAIPANSAARGSVVEARAKGKLQGDALLKLALTRLTVNGEPYAIETSMVSEASAGKGKRTAVATGGGAGLGALIGGIAGGGKGAAIGGLIGGGAGLTGGALTGNKQIELPAESVLNFRLSEPLTIK